MGRRVFWKYLNFNASYTHRSRLHVAIDYRYIQIEKESRIIIMANVNHDDEVPVFEPNQHNDVPVVPEPVLEDEDEDPKEEEF
ncbi:hypothetical protein Tco_1304341 [Tanacetum coccineum]